MDLILGSSSPRRKRLLEEEGLDFEVVVPDIDEEKYNYGETPERVKRIARKKMEAVLEELNKEEAVVLTADTMVEFRGEVLGKPESKEKAFGLLKDIFGNSCEVYTGYCIYRNDQVTCDVESTEIKFREASEEEVSEYVESEPVENMAGGFNVNEGKPGERFVKDMDGYRSTVVGLPMEVIVPLLE